MADKTATNHENVFLGCSNVEATGDNLCKVLSTWAPIHDTVISTRIKSSYDGLTTKRACMTLT